MIHPYLKAWGKHLDSLRSGRNRSVLAGFLPETAGTIQTGGEEAFVLHLRAFLGVWCLPEDNPLRVAKGRA